MKKNLFLLAITFFVFGKVFAGGLLTNTNQSVSFLRNPARGASTEIDAAYTNPAGLAFLSHEGLSLSINNQSAFQTRTLTTTFAPFAGFGGDATKVFEGKAKAWVIPSLQAAYKTNKWVFSANIAVAGGGGTLDFSKGLPSFESQVALLPLLLTSNGIPATQYALDSRLKGSSLTIGIQLGATYKISDQFSAYLGGRASIIDNSYEGYIHNIQANVGGSLVNLNSYFTAAAAQATGAANSLQPIIDGGYGNAPLSMVLSQEQLAKIAAGLGLSEAQAGAMTVSQAQGGFIQKSTMATGVATKTADMNLNTKQTGSGFAPIIGLDYKWNNLNVGLTYEFKSSIQLTNKTTENSTGQAQFDDGFKTPSDIPALLSIGAKYDILPALTVSAGYHHFFDSDAKMLGDRQKLINGGTNEYLAGVEYRFNQKFLASCGTQITRNPVEDAFQTDLSYALNSMSFGFGGAWNVTENIRINAAYFFTNYKDWTTETYATDMVGSLPSSSTIFGRTNKTFGIGVDFRF